MSKRLRNEREKTVIIGYSSVSPRVLRMTLNRRRCLRPIILLLPYRLHGSVEFSR